MINNKLGFFLKEITDLGKVDLHSHSTASDGSLPPDQVMELAKTKSLDYIALTDHDTIDGIKQIIKLYPTLDLYLSKNNQNLTWLLEQTKANLLPKYPILIPGVEFSVIFENQEIHLLAYFSGADIERLGAFLAEQRIAREQRNFELIKRLHQMNIPIPDNELDPTPTQPVTGRVKIARWLLENNYVTSIEQAFQKYLAEGKPAYIPRKRVPVKLALDIIESANGFPVVAHPHQYNWCTSDQLLEQKIYNLTKISEIGVEVYHSNANLEQQKMILRLARKMNLPYTAGSDFHGINKEKHELYTNRLSPANFYGKKTTAQF